MSQKNTMDNSHQKNEQQTDSQQESNMGLVEAKSSKYPMASIIYDSVMLLVIFVDLLLITTDAILMSGLTQSIVGLAVEHLHFTWLSSALEFYQSSWHSNVDKIGDFFTVFLICEVALRWLLAIINKSYYRWFFFPFVHWYEVISCFPQFRALRLLRVVVIGYRLYQMNIRFFVRKSWVKTGKFYYNMVLEEISDRVIMIALNSIESELKNSNAHQKLIRSIIDTNRQEIEKLVGGLLQTEVAPALKKHANLTRAGVGNSVYRALANVPELNKYLRMIPIAGRMIEGEIQNIGQSLAENIADELMQPFCAEPHHGKTTNDNFALISKEVSNISSEQESLEALVSSIIFSSIDTIREQITDQQWRDQQADALDIDKPVL